MQLRHGFCLVLTGTLLSCARQQLPIEEEIIHLGLTSHSLVCHVRGIAELHDLSFTYRNSQQAYGTLNVFRLKGSGLEIVLYNPNAQDDYRLRLYKMEQTGSASEETLRRDFQVFKRELAAPLSRECQPEGPSRASRITVNYGDSAINSRGCRPGFPRTGELR
jgi:hypothetical protein